MACKKQSQRALPKGSKNQGQDGSQECKSPQQPLPEDAGSDLLPPSPSGKPLKQQGSLTAEPRGTKRLVDGEPLRRSPRFAPVKNEPAAPAPPASDIKKPIDPVAYWAREQHWPKAYSQTSKMAHLLARPGPRVTRSSSPNIPSPADLRPKKDKIAYNSPFYARRLAIKGSFMKDSNLGIADESKNLIRDLLNRVQPVPSESFFDEDIFHAFCEKFAPRNETRVILDISRLIVPSAEAHALRAKDIDYLYESNNELWNNSIPLIGPIPKPNYSVGFGFEAFTNEQWAKLDPFIGVFEEGDKSFFVGTGSTFFPFLACEAKCHSSDLVVAECQNAHSMTLAVRGVAELFRWRGRDSEVDRQILAFSITYDQHSVGIYGHYPVMKKDIQYYRHTIKSFDFTANNGKEKWTAYQFTKNVYDIWVPAHLKRLSSVIDDIPDDLDFAPASVPSDLSIDPPTEEDASSADGAAGERKKKRKQ